MFDLHTHHARCGHAVGFMEEYIESAIEKGIRCLGISDHSPYFFADEDHPHPGLAMARSEFINYVEEFIRLKKKYENRIELLLGVESDVFREHIDLYGRVYARYPLDYVIGSVHFTSPLDIMKGFHWDVSPEEARLLEATRYVELLQIAARSRWVNIIGHLDRPKRWYPPFKELLAPHVDSTLQILAEEDVSIEVNTSGFQLACQEWFPSVEVIERACFYGVDITFGSDAHHPDRIGDGWEQVVDTLSHIGYKRSVVYKQRRPCYFEIGR